MVSGREKLCSGKLNEKKIGKLGNFADSQGIETEKFVKIATGFNS